jgi:uncharacterized protein YdiU (UPF0061 family)
LETRGREDIFVGMRAVNPLFIPRNHRIEAAIRGAETGDFGRLHDLNEVLASSFDDQPAFAPPSALRKI